MSLKKVDDSDVGLHETAEGMLMGVRGLHLPQVVVERDLEGVGGRKDLDYWRPWAQESLPPSLPELGTQTTNLLDRLGLTRAGSALDCGAEATLNSRLLLWDGRGPTGHF